MDLVDRIDKSAFLGREWLVWLWFKSELFEGPFELGSFGPVEAWLEAQLTLEGSAQESEQSLLKGPAPSASPEAHEALRQGKLPTAGRISIRRGELTFSFSFKADTLALGAVKLPTLVKEQTDEQFYERMFLLEDLEAMLDALWEEFLVLRLSPAWQSEIVPAIRGWVHERPSADVAAYQGWLQEAGGVASASKPADKPALELDSGAGDHKVAPAPAEQSASDQVAPAPAE